MRKLLTNKFVLCLVLIAIFFFFGSITNTLSIDNRGIVVGLGLDYVDDEIALSCQTLVAGGTGADKVSNNTYAVTVAKGETLGACMQKISLDSAEFLSFAHCNSILIGKNMANSGVLRETLVELLLNSKIMENTSLVYVDSLASDMLKEKIAINLMTSFSVQRMVSYGKQNANIISCTIKDYLSNSLSSYSAIVMPMLSRGVEVNESSNESNADSEQKILLSLQKGAVLTRSGVVDLLDEEQTLIYNMVKKEFTQGNLSIKVDQKHEGLLIKSKSSQIKLTKEQNYVANYDIKLVLSDMKYINSYDRNEDIIQKIENDYPNALKSKTDNLYTSFANMGVDIFGLYDKFYAKYGGKFKNSPNFLQIISFNSNYTVKTSE